MPTYAHDVIAAFCANSRDFAFWAELAINLELLSLTLFASLTIMMRSHFTLKAEFSIATRRHDKRVATKPS
jgi:hypothetical protein